MPAKHEQTTTTGQPAHIAHVPNQHLPLIDVEGNLHHPINDAIGTCHRLIVELIAHTRLTATQRYTLTTVLTEFNTITDELKALAAYNLFHNDTPALPVKNGGNN